MSYNHIMSNFDNEEFYTPLNLCQKNCDIPRVCFSFENVLHIIESNILE